MARSLALLGLALLVVACGSPPRLSNTPEPSGPMTTAPGASMPSTSGVGIVLPAPGSSSPIYAPNPSSIVVAIDPGHGGCLDWGVPNPWDNTAANAEKMSTLGIALQLRDRLRAAGVTVVMSRDADEAIAGDDYAPQGCNGPPFRDVNGDGLAGFGPDMPEGTLARDELQARIDLANLARADVLLSIHINSFVDDDGQPIEIAASQTFYTDETTWGAASMDLAADVQSGAVTGLSGAPYPRQDRGTEAKNFYIVAPPLFQTTEDRPDPRKQPTRGALMPAVLSEVGSITLEAEAMYLGDQAGQAALADGLFDGLAAWFAARPLAVRWTIDGDALPPEPAPGAGPPFWAPVLPKTTPLVTLTNSGSRTWPDDVRLLGGWETSSAPYLRVAPVLDELSVDLPRLRAGESVTVELPMTAPPSRRAVAWIDLEAGGQRLSEMGSPALQAASEAR